MSGRERTMRKADAAWSLSDDSAPLDVGRDDESLTERYAPRTLADDVVWPWMARRDFSASSFTRLLRSTW